MNTASPSAYSFAPRALVVAEDPVRLVAEATSSGFDVAWTCDPDHVPARAALAAGRCGRGGGRRGHRRPAGRGGGDRRRSRARGRVLPGGGLGAGGREARRDGRGPDRPVRAGRTRWRADPVAPAPARAVAGHGGDARRHPAAAAGRSGEPHRADAVGDDGRRRSAGPAVAGCAARSTVSGWSATSWRATRR